MYALGKMAKLLDNAMAKGIIDKSKVDEAFDGYNECNSHNESNDSEIIEDIDSDQRQLPEDSNFLNRRKNMRKLLEKNEETDKDDHMATPSFDDTKSQSLFKLFTTM